MQLTVTTFLSVDGVYQGPGGPNEDRSGGFDRGGWLVPHFDEATGQFMDSVFQQVDAFLLGRRTYDIFAASWPNATDPNDPVASKLNTLPKYVASTTLKDPEWANTTVLEGDLASAVRKLKDREGRELQVHGSGRLVQFLLDNDLVDRLNLLVFPVIVGAGRRLFPDSGMATGLALDESRTTPSGVTISVYRPTGRPEFGEVELG
ncbi:MAG TPA: dihydrofolate reductase family protein [Candidatus Limnocylindria bacterium]|nr:dihydrofolate reductase family protein [Candidatus Limnocylindria bacterium]